MRAALVSVPRGAVAAGVACGVARAVETPGLAYVEVLVIGIVVGLVAALVGLRRAVHIDPALAFGR